MFKVQGLSLTPRHSIPGSYCGGDAEGQHEAHGIGGGVDGNARQLPLSIRQQACQDGHHLTRPPLRYQQHACTAIGGWTIRGPVVQHMWLL